MCQFAAFVLTKTEILWTASNSHEDIIDTYGLRHLDREPIGLVRVEVTPPEQVDAIDDLYRWEFKVDVNHKLPDWTFLNDPDLKSRTFKALTKRSRDEGWFKKETSDTQVMVGLGGQAKISDSSPQLDTQATAGPFGKAVTHYRGQAVAATKGRAEGGLDSQAVAGREGTAITEDFSQAMAGVGGLAISGEGGQSQIVDQGAAQAGDSGQATAGENGLAKVGTTGQAMASIGGKVLGGLRGKAVSGYCGQSIVGELGHALAGNMGQAIGDFQACAESGNRGHSIALEGLVRAGELGIIQIKWFDHTTNRHRITVGYVGENGIKPDTWYEVNRNGELVEVHVIPEDLDTTKW